MSLKRFFGSIPKVRPSLQQESEFNNPDSTVPGRWIHGRWAELVRGECGGVMEYKLSTGKIITFLDWDLNEPVDDSSSTDSEGEAKLQGVVPLGITFVTELVKNMWENRTLFFK